jgi:LEA14-like dessication related protein
LVLGLTLGRRRKAGLPKNGIFGKVSVHKMKKAVIRFPAMGIVALCMLCIAGSSCRTLESVFREPVVSLRSVDLVNLGPGGADFICSLDMENPNTVPLSFPEIAWELFVGTNSFHSGMVPEGEAINPGSVKTLEIPINLNYAELLGALKSIKGRKDVDYQIALETRFLLPVLGERVWNFEHRGRLPLVQMISLRDPLFRIEGLDFNGVDILCSLNVDNPNPFPVPFPEMGYNYAVRNSNFVTGTVEHPGDLAAGGLTAVDIRLRVIYSDLYRSLPLLRDAGEAACLFTLSSLVSLPGFEGERLSLDIPGSLPLLKEPILSFRGISVKNIALSKIDLEFNLDVDNPNGFDFRIKHLEYDVSVNNRPWADGVVTPQTGLSAGRKTTLPITFTLASPSMVKDVTDSITRGMDVAYNVKGTMTFSSTLRGFSDSSVPLNLAGHTRLRR